MLLLISTSIAFRHFLLLSEPPRERWLHTQSEDPRGTALIEVPQLMFDICLVSVWLICCTYCDIPDKIISTKQEHYTSIIYPLNFVILYFHKVKGDILQTMENWLKLKFML